MNEPDRSAPDPATEAMDDLDTEVLHQLRQVATAADPVPSGLVDRIQFALSMYDIDAELMRLQEEPLPAGVRGEQATRTVTFDSESLTIMISILTSGGDEVRLDGWIAPAGTHRVELRLVGDRRVLLADDQGRFVFDRVPRGLLQMAVHHASGA